MKIYNFEQKTEEWLRIRLGKLTASNAHPIKVNGKGLETLAKQKAIEEITMAVPEQYTNNDIERGNELEPMARSCYELDKGIKVIEVGFVELNENVGCSPDGLIGKDGLIEIKCPNDQNYFEAIVEGKFYPCYVSQCQFQMMVTNRKWNDLTFYNPNFDIPIFIKRIERDEKYIEDIKKGLERGIELKQEFIKKYNERKNANSSDNN